jgi:uncharacterized membrane protein
MTDQTTPTEGATSEAQGAATGTQAAAQPEAAAQDAVVGLVTDGAYYLVVAQFATMDQAEAAYADLENLESRTSLRIDGVVVASCDAEGKIHLGKVTDHSTKTGLKWGIVGGVALGIIFPPSILGSAASLGIVGSVLGKVRNLSHRGALADELAGVMTPNTAGIIALVEDTAVVEIEKAMAKADRIVSKAVDKQIAAEIDREARVAKESLDA